MYMLNTLYINLEHRTDRRAHIEKELKKFPFLQVERFNAVRMNNGALGCSISHLKCLELAKERGWTQVLIVEDDIQFLNPDLFVTQLNQFLKRYKYFDVALIAGNNMPPYIRIDDCSIKIANCNTTTGYIVNQKYYDKLIANYKEGIDCLTREPNNKARYAIDIYWKTLQMEDMWFLITPPTVIQREDYSDVEEKNVDYTRLFLDIDKTK